MNEKAQAFLQAVEADPALKARVEAAVAGLEGEALAQKGAELAREAGFDLAPEDFAFAPPAPAGELDEAELAGVAGGKDVCACVGGGGGEVDGECICVCVLGGHGFDQLRIRNERGQFEYPNSFACACLLGGGGEWVH